LRHHTHNHHSGQHEATEKQINLWAVAKLQKDCTLKDRQQKCGIEAGDGAQGNDLNAVHVGDADLDRENTKSDNMEPRGLMNLI
jgi:hypothetical protein